MKSETQTGQLHQDKKLLSLGFSPCPNDTFMFDALVNDKIDTGNLSFGERLEDVETLNRLALKKELDITKMSYAAYPAVAKDYQLLTAGSALGHGVGPLFISLKTFTDTNEIKSVAIPGMHTTAYFLFKMFFPHVKETKELIFSEIENAVLNGEADAGVIIHENRFTYQAKGLKKIADLGELWEKKTGLPIPLGGIAVRRSLDEQTKKMINELVRKSVEYAFEHPEDSRTYVRQHSQEMSDDVIQKHIDLYVNENSLSLSVEAKKAIQLFLNVKDDGDIFVR